MRLLNLGKHYIPRFDTTPGDVTNDTLLDFIKQRKPHRMVTVGPDRYWNLYPRSIPIRFRAFKGLLETLAWVYKRFRYNPVFDEEVPILEPDHSLIAAGPAMCGSPIVTWVGHACLLVQTDTATFLTDPTWSETCSIIPDLKRVRRLRRPGISFDKLPHIDFVLITHSHYDHLDIATLKRLATRPFGAIPTFYVTLGVKQLLLEQTSIPKTSIVEMDWMDEHRHSTGATITCTPAQHYGFRNPACVEFSALWASFVVNLRGFKFFFAGDSGYCPVFRAIGRSFGPFDLAAIPIGSFQPRKVNYYNHMSPGEAILTHYDVGARVTIGIHWGTFMLGDNFLSEGREEFNTQWARVCEHGEATLRTEIEQDYAYRARVKTFYESMATSRAGTLVEDGETADGLWMDKKSSHMRAMVAGHVFRLPKLTRRGLRGHTRRQNIAEEIRRGMYEMKEIVTRPTGDASLSPYMREARVRNLRRTASTPMIIKPVLGSPPLPVMQPAPSMAGLKLGDTGEAPPQATPPSMLTRRVTVGDYDLLTPPMLDLDDEDPEVSGEVSYSVRCLSECADSQAADGSIFVCMWIGETALF